MGLKFERSDDLEKLFESFAVDPQKKERPKEEDPAAEKGQNEKEAEQ